MKFTEDIGLGNGNNLLDFVSIFRAKFSFCLALQNRELQVGAC